MIAPFLQFHIYAIPKKHESWEYWRNEYIVPAGGITNTVTQNMIFKMGLNKLLKILT